MKIRNIAAILLMSSTLTYAQDDLKQKTAVLADGSKLTYNLLASNSQVKQGPYLVQATQEDLYVRGKYDKNARVGNWMFFNKGNSLFLGYNYDTKKVTFFNVNSILDITVKILSEDTAVTKNASVPLPLCSLDEFKSLMLAKLQELTFYQKDQLGDVTPVVFTTDIDADGKAKYSASYILGGEMKNTVIDLSKTPFKLDWLPSSYQGKNIASQLIYKDEIKKDFESVTKRVNWN